MIAPNFLIMTAVDPNMQGNNKIMIILIIRCSNHHTLSFVFHCRKKAVDSKAFPGLPPHVNSPCSGEKRKTGRVREYYLLPLDCPPDLVISTPAQLFLYVLMRKKSFSDGGSCMISGFIELTANNLGRN